MKVSIVTICYNSAETIRETIESVISQTYKDIEYIIVDGASKDNTCDIVRSFGDRISRFVSEPDRGIYDAMNKGVKLATGDVIGILNSDDFYADANVITDIVSTFEKTNALGVYADLVYVNRDNVDKITRTWKSGVYEEGKFLFGWMPPHPTFFVKREVYQTYGHYTTELRSSSDYEFMLRVIHKEKISVGYLPRVITKMRVGGQSNVTLTNRKKANREDRRAWEMNGLKPYFFTIALKPLRKIPQFLR
ncbi:MAG: glycosyltransferase family 2 protein [Flavobacteriales bacterium]|jgi:glycosyltransferase involved in cell wall biosynthesis